MPWSYTDPVARILITGMSGAGKSTLLRTLAERGYLTVDTDYDGWTLAGGRWDAARMSSLLSREADVVVAGTVDNQGDFYDCFDRVVLLSVPLDILIERVSSRMFREHYGMDPSAYRVSAQAAAGADRNAPVSVAHDFEMAAG